MKRVLTTFCFLALFAGLPLLSSAQCKGFTKKVCMPEIDPYIFNGQLNSAVLNEGDIAELLLTFYAGQNYRVLVCAQEELGDLEFKLLDTEYNVVFDNKEHKNTNSWDFASNTTQQLIVQVMVPEHKGNNGDVAKSGCVSILVGFNEEE